MQVTWAQILWANECAHCGKPTERTRGLSRAFCPHCTANLPGALAAHLDRSTSGKWFMAWWHVAMRELRIDSRRRHYIHVEDPHRAARRSAQ